MMNSADEIRFRKLRGSEQDEFDSLKNGGTTVEPVQKMGFDNEGNVIATTRAYRRRKIQMPIDERNLPKKKKRAKKSKRNYLKKRKK